MSEYQRLKARAQELQLAKEAEVKKDLAAKREKELATRKDEESRRKRLDEAAAEARRRELNLANAALTTIPTNGSSSTIAVKTAKSVEYNPFAEDEFTPASINDTSRTKAKFLSGGGRAGAGGSGGKGGVASGSSVRRERAGGGGGGGSGGGGEKRDRKDKDTTPPLLSRKEKAARAFAQQLKKGNSKESMFSIRNLVETDDRGMSTSPRPAHTSIPIKAYPNGTAREVARSTLSSMSNGPNRKMIPPGTRGAGGLNDMRKLAPGREGWDRRSIDEIARDLRAARGGGGKVDSAIMSRTKSAEGLHGNGNNTTNGNAKRPRSSSPLKKGTNIPNTSNTPLAKSKPKPPPIPSSARPSTSTSTTKALPIHKRHRSPSSSSSSTSSADIDQPPHRRKLSGVVNLREDDVSAVSATIQAMFRRPGRPQPVRYADEGDSDASSDMEAGMSDVEEEERRAAKIARREDELAEKEERERKERKERLKREGLRK